MKTFYELEKEACTLCDGSGWHDVTTNPLYPTSRDCRCTARAKFRSKVGPDIYDSPDVGESPLEHHLHSNCYVEADRIDFLPQLRRALLVAGLEFFHRRTTDAEILDVWLGKEDDSEVQYSSLRELVTDPTLLIITLGVIKRDNRALADVIHEALNIRLYAGKPTWLAVPWQKGVHRKDVAYHSRDLAKLLEADFTKFEFGPQPSSKHENLYELELTNL